jgi:hypothetical protein
LSANEQSESNAEAMPGASANSEGIRWRPWPCPTCRRRLSPISFLIGCAEADGTVPQVLRSPEQIAATQVRRLLDWISACPHTTWKILAHPKGAEGSEHIVFLDPNSATVWKVTHPGVFGDSYYLVDDRIHQKNDSPLEYLIRLRLWRKLFRSAPFAVGITASGQIVSKHRFVSGVIPTQDEVDAFLFEAGLVPVKQRFWLWKKIEPENEIWVGDARDENFVKAPMGIVPIDLRIWIATPKKL